jgi:hypothetical protein
MCGEDDKNASINMWKNHNMPYFLFHYRGIRQNKIIRVVMEIFKKLQSQLRKRDVLKEVKSSREIFIFSNAMVKILYLNFGKNARFREK